MKKSTLVLTFLLLFFLLLACEANDESVYDEDALISEVTEPTTIVDDVPTVILDEDAQNDGLESANEPQLEIFDVVFGEVFRFGDFYIEISDELVFVYYELEDDVVFDNTSVGKHFYVPVVLRSVQTGEHDFDFSDDRWQMENHLIVNTVIYNLQSDGDAQFDVWREPGRDAFSTLVGITHLAWLDEHYSQQGAYTFIRGSFSEDGMYNLMFYSDRDVAMSAHRLVLDVVWPEIYTTYKFETIVQDSQVAFEVSGFEVSIEFDIRFYDFYPYFGRNHHYVPMVFTNLNEEEAHLSILEPTMFAQNGTNAIRRVYLDGEQFWLPELMAIDAGMSLRMEFPFFGVTCGQANPHRTLQLSERLEDLDNSIVIIRHHVVHICVFDDMDECNRMLHEWGLIS